MHYTVRLANALYRPSRARSLPSVTESFSACNLRSQVPPRSHAYNTHPRLRWRPMPVSPRMPFACCRQRIGAKLGQIRMRTVHLPVWTQYGAYQPPPDIPARIGLVEPERTRRRVAAVALWRCGWPHEAKLRPPVVELRHTHVLTVGGGGACTSHKESLRYGGCSGGRRRCREHQPLQCSRWLMCIAACELAGERRGESAVGRCQDRVKL